MRLEQREVMQYVPAARSEVAEAVPKQLDVNFGLTRLVLGYGLTTGSAGRSAGAVQRLARTFQRGYKFVSVPICKRFETDTHHREA